jgi:formamidopyrimidine-DNA glycosylase
VPPRFEVEVRDFLHVHRRGGEGCPRCGARISEIAPGGFVTNFCRGCQR